jgi:hypothetical protein
MSDHKVYGAAVGSDGSGAVLLEVRDLLAGFERGAVFEGANGDHVVRHHRGDVPLQFERDGP